MVVITIQDGAITATVTDENGNRHGFTFKDTGDFYRRIRFIAENLKTRVAAQHAAEAAKGPAGQLADALKDTSGL